MEIKHLTFLLLLSVLILLTGLIGFGKKNQYITNLKYAVPAALLSAFLFTILDTGFVKRSIWWYNPEYITGIRLGSMMLAPALYHFLLPLLGLAIYLKVKARPKKKDYSNLYLSGSLVLLVLFVILTFSLREKLYAFFIFFLTSVYFGYTIFRNRFKSHYADFYTAFFILVIPYTVLSGILTALPVIEYNPQHILGWHLFNIPVESYVTLFLQLLMATTIFEFLYERRIF